MAVAVGVAFGITFEEKPALIAAGAIVAIAVSQLILQSASAVNSSALVLRGLAMSAVVSLSYFALHALFKMALANSVLPALVVADPFHTGLAMVIVGVFLALSLLQQVLKYAPTVLGDGLYMHLYNGLYIDVYITRLLKRVWPSPAIQPGVPPAPFATLTSHGD